MKKYFSLLAICSLMSFGFVFGAPEDQDESFQTFNQSGTTNANIAANGVVNVSALAPDGKIIIGGDFTLYKGVAVNRLARINNDGTLDTTFNPVVAPLTAATIGATGGAINTIAIAPGGTAENYSIILGGAFTKYNNVVQNRLSKIDCTTVSGVQTCRLDAAFVAPVATSGAVSGSVNAIAFAPGGTAANYQIIIGGLFPKFNNFNQNNISRITCTVSGASQTCALNTNTFTTGTQIGTTGAVNAIVIVPGGTATDYSIIIGGALTKYNNVNQKYLSKLDCTAVGNCTLDTSLVGTGTTDGASNTINAIAVFPGGDATNYSILIGGTFTKFNNITQNRLAKIVCIDDMAGARTCSLEEDFVGITAADGTDGAIETVTIYNNGIVVIGGAFTKYDGVLRNRIAQLEAGGEIDAGFNNILPFGPDNTVQHLLIQTDGKIIVSGLFDSYSGLVTGRITRLSGMTSAYSAEGCAAGLFYCGFDNSCVANASQCASCPADFTQKTPIISPTSFTPSILPNPGEWSLITNAGGITPATRYNYDMVVVNKKIYVIGGFGTNKTEVYDPLTNAWASLAPYPVGTSSPGIMAATVGDKIYTFLGKNTYQYNVSTNTWTQKANIPTAKSSGSAEVIDGKIYLVGSVSDKKLHIYDPLRDVWTTGPDIPKAFQYTEAAVSGGKLYLIGGAYTNTIYEYNPCENRWLQKTNMPVIPGVSPLGNWSHNSAVTVNGEVYMVGGVVQGGGTVYGKLRKYNPQTQAWGLSLPDMPYSAYHVRSVAIDGKIYVMGGTQVIPAPYSPTNKIAVYNAASNITTDETISACNCQPACGEGKYYSVADNTCKPNREIIGNPFCNKNNICETGESCNCGDCVNGGLDDKSACGISSGVQMYCSQDDEDFYLPPTEENTKSFTDRQIFLDETNSAIFLYDYVLSKVGQAGYLGITTTTYNFPRPDGSQNVNGISIKAYAVLGVDGNYMGIKYRNNNNYMGRGNFSIPGPYLAISGTENIDFNFTKPIKSFGIDMYESTNTGGQFCNSACVKSTFTFTAYNNGVQVGLPQTFIPSDTTSNPNAGYNKVNFFGFSAPSEFNQVRVRETGGIDNEFFGRIYYQDRSAGAQQCETKKVLMTSTANYPDNSYMIFYDYTPREVNYNGKKVYVYNPIGNTTQSLSTITANPSLAYSKIKKFTTPFQFMDHKLTATNSVNIFKDTGFGPVPSALLCFIRPDGTERCQYNDAQVGYPVFAKTPSTGLQADLIYATSRDDTGSVTYGRADIVRAFDVEICQPTGSDICSIGACCPAGTKWDCDTNACVLDEFMCPAGQVQTVAPGSTVCLLSITPSTSPSGSKMVLTGYDNLQGNCTLAAQTFHDVPTKPISPVGSTTLSVSSDITSITAMTESSFALVADAQQINPLLTCPANHVSQCFRGEGDGSFLCGCYPIKSVKLTVNITDSTNTNRTTTLGDGTKIQNNTPITLFASDTYILDTAFAGGDTTDMGVKRQTGYVEFYTHDRLNYNDPGTLRGTITLSGAKILGVDAPYQKSASLNLEAPNGDFVTQISDSTVNFYSYFSEPGDKWKIYYEIPENVPINPEYICEMQGCLEGEYFCQAEGICKPANQSCGTVTCNSDGTCDEDESCNCADCNSQIDHCGESAGQQLFCTKDAIAIDTTPKMKVNFTRTDNVPNAITLGNSTVISDNPSFNITANGTPIEDSALLYDTPNLSVRRHNGYVEFLARKNSAVYGYYTGSITLENATVNRVEAGSTTYPTYPDIGLEVIEADYATKANTTVVNFQLAFSQQGDSFRIYYDLSTSPSLTSPADKWEAYSYSPAFIFLAKHPITSYTTPGTFQVYNPERIIFNMTKEQFMANPTAAINNARIIPVGRTRVPTSRLQFNMPQLLSETANVQATTITNLKSSVLSRFLCKTPGVASTDCHVNNLGAFIPAFSYTPTGTIYGSATDGSGFVGMAAYQRFGTFDVACQEYDYTTVRYLPNTDPRTQDWSNINGIGTKQNDAGKLVWQVNDGGTSEGNNAVIYKRLAQPEMVQFLTKGGKVTASIKNLSAGLPTGSAAGLLASYFELARGEDVSVNGAVKSPKRFTFVFGMDADKTPTIIGLGTNGTTYIAPGDSTYKYRVDGGADKYHTYEMLYKPSNDTVDLYVDGVKRISDFPGNTVWPGYRSQLKGNVGVFFGSGSSPGIAKTNYGEVKLTIKNDACTTPIPPAVAQVGACCPAGTQWNSAENKCMPNCATGTSWDEVQKKCIAPTCAEGQYYCHSELKCKPANQTCGTVTCNNNGTCNEFESCDCADCNGQIDHCGVVNGEQLFCTKDPSPQCYTDRFPYCFPLCLDGYTLDTATNQCVVSGGASVSPSSGTLATTQIGACCPDGAQWSSANNKCETNCTTTQAPSELKAGVDQPYISCTAGPTGTTHFKYRLTDTSAPTATPFISAIYTNGTQVLHPIINAAGNYKVECFYGNATVVDTGNTATPSTCVKNIVVKNDANTQGCEGLVSYKGTTLTTTLEDTSGFTARFQCINRVSENPAILNPFRIQYANNNFIPLGFATVIDPNLSSSIGLNRLSAQDQYAFELGNTSVTCAVKVGNGYSTNTSCQKNACVGGSCSTPQTFSVVHSGDLTCTTQAEAEYEIGCNPDAPQSNRDYCINWLQQAAGSTAYNAPFNTSFVFNGTTTSVTCHKYEANHPALEGLNMQDNIVCKANMKNGEKYTILAADVGGSPINSLQTTTYTVKKDTTDPEILPLELYLNPSLTLAVTDFNRWYNVPLTVVARCSDKPGISDGNECACAPEMVSSPTFWSPGIAHSTFGPDIMHYTRTISTSTSGITAQVKDTAGNLSTILPAIDLRIDTQAPSVTVTETAVTGSTRTLKLDVSDTLSKIWKTTNAPSGATNMSGVIYRTGPKADAQALMFDEDCNVSSPLYATISETTTLPNVPVNIPSINTNTTVVTYCVQDNAGNVTRGMYPTMSGGCFSASNMSTVPNFDTYKTSLISRINNNQYGYSFSENTTDANCFRGILANNVTTLIANQVNPRSATTLASWDTDRAIVKNTSSTLNMNRYYYYSYPSANTLNIDVPPTGSGNKTVVVEGGDIQINTNIDYSGTGKLLILVARKNNNGQGGNIRIAPSVSRIDAILIADGGALINTDPNAAGQRLTINGRIYSYNTRGGSLVVTGTELTDAPQGKRFNNATLTNATNLSESRAQDLERFRVISIDGTAQCSTHLNYQVLPTNQLPPILQRPTTFSGTCGF